MSGEDSHQWFVYLMQCADGSFYTGVTTDLARRLRQHNGEIRGALATHGAGARLILCGRKRVMIVPKHKNANMWCVVAPVLKNLSWWQATVSPVAVMHRDWVAAMARRVFKGD